jgi:putative serine protease PepD
VQATTESRHGAWRVWAGVALAALVGGVVGGVIVTETGSTTSSSASSPCDATKIARDDLPSVVTISATDGSAAGTGSGEIIRSSGYILTNNHVVALAADGGSVNVLFSDGQTAAATIVGRDPQTDLAVIRVKVPYTLRAIPLGSSSGLNVGQQVVALGAPLGLTSTVTGGIVSALDRTIQVPGEHDRSALLIDAIQTDAAINPGNSGGSLVDCSGRLVGIPSAGATVPSESGQSSVGNVGLGFAIPVDLAKTISSEIISTGTVVHAYFGLQAVPVPPSAAQEAGLPEGLYVRQVVSGSPAEKAGLQAGDVITEVGGQKAIGTEQLAVLTLTKKPGTAVPLTYERDGRSTSATVTLGTQP